MQVLQALDLCLAVPNKKKQERNRKKKYEQYEIIRKLAVNHYKLLPPITHTKPPPKTLFVI